MKVGAIIQARLESVRLPRKSLTPIIDKPILWHVIHRTKVAIPNVIVATPNQEIADYAIKQEVKTFIGDENDVLDRYYQAAKKYGVRNIVRITADNPLVDPDIILQLLEFYTKGKFDYVSNNLKRTYPLGLDVEIFSFKALEKAWGEGVTPLEREHVTPYIRNHPELFKLGNMENDADLSNLRWTVDYAEDLAFAKYVYAQLGNNFRMKDVVRLCNAKT